MLSFPQGSLQVQARPMRIFVSLVPWLSRVAILPACPSTVPPTTRMAPGCGQAGEASIQTAGRIGTRGLL